MCVVDVAASVRHDVVTDEQYILEVVPFYDERWSTDEPMTLEELAAWIGQPDLKTPMSQPLEDSLGGWFVFDANRQELSKDQVESLWRWYTEAPVTGSDPDAVTVYDGEAVDEDEDDSGDTEGLREAAQEVAEAVNLSEEAVKTARELFEISGIARWKAILTKQRFIVAERNFLGTHEA